MSYKSVVVPVEDGHREVRDTRMRIDPNILN